MTVHSEGGRKPALPVLGITVLPILKFELASKMDVHAVEILVGYSRAVACHCEILSWAV